MDRTTHGAYDDPLDLVWRRCLECLGIQLEIRDDVFASWDGRGTLAVCPPTEFDPDDSLAQLVLHELCHALVQGVARRQQVDWGLPQDGDEAALREHACHRLQAALLDLYGLRDLLSVTTDWRPYWDGLPDDPLADDADPAVGLARAAWPDAARGPWSDAVHTALRATADLGDVVRAAAPSTSVWSRTRPRTPVGLAVGPVGQTCGSCTWRDSRCLATDQEVDAAWPACLRWEARLTEDDCRSCGACCREGFHVVDVEPDDPFCAAHPALVTEAGGHCFVARPGGRCVALEPGEPYTCSVYGDRPVACRAFEVAGEACLEARRRVGWTRA